VELVARVHTSSGPDHRAVSSAARLGAARSLQSSHRLPLRRRADCTYRPSSTAPPRNSEAHITRERSCAFKCIAAHLKARQRRAGAVEKPGGYRNGRRTRGRMKGLIRSSRNILMEVSDPCSCLVSEAHVWRRATDDGVLLTLL
jgi:hypothetical protein